MQSTRPFEKITFSIIFLLSLIFAPIAYAEAPPVRIAVVTGGGSGIEQSIVDRIESRLQENRNVALSTVNPDWYVVCNIKEFMDQVSGQIRYNGSILVKSQGGQIISSIAVQKYSQDFSLSPGTPLNKALVDKTAKEVIYASAQRAIIPIERAVEVEMDTREKIVKAEILADSEEYDAAINSLRLVTPDSPHFKNVRNLMDEFQAEKNALENLKKAEALAKSGKAGNAIALLKHINPKSRYYPKAKSLMAAWGGRAKAVSKKPTRKLVKSKTTAKAKTGNSSKDAELKALDKVLKMEKKALEDAHNKVKKQLNK